MKGTLLERFWAKVDKTPGYGPGGECWRWSAAVNKQTGYGVFARSSLDGLMSSHRQSWIIHFGAIPDGLCVLHRCDYRPCVRPDHLFLGTLLDNGRDMAAKGRGTRKTICKNGHIKDENLYIWRGRRKDCSPCAVARATRAKARRKERARLA